MLDKNYDARREAYNTYMKNVFKTIPTMITKILSQKQKVKKLMTEIGGACYRKKIIKRLAPLNIPKISKTSQEMEDEILKTI